MKRAIESRRATANMVCGELRSAPFANTAKDAAPEKPEPARRAEDLLRASRQALQISVQAGVTFHSYRNFNKWRMSAPRHTRLATKILTVLAMAAALGAAAGVARAGSEINRAMKLGPGGRFVLETFNGSVSVMGSNENGADVSITSNYDNIQNDVDIRFDENPGDVEVHVRPRDPLDFIGWMFSGPHLHFDVSVPKNTRVEIRTSGGSISAFALGADADLRTAGGSIQASQTTGNLRAFTSGGTIRAQVVHGDANLGTSGGGIEADAIDGALVARTSGGWVHIDGVGGRVDARTSGGQIVAAFAKGDSQGGELYTSGGSIEAKIDPAANLQIEASTSGGGVESDLPLRVSGRFARNYLRGTLGAGGDMLRMRTSGGSIHIRGL